MTQLATILKQPTQQMAMTKLLADIEAENRAALFECEVEAQCRQAKGMAKMRCGYIGAGTVGGCATRRQFLGGGDVPKQ